MKLKRLFQFLIIASLLMTGVGSVPRQVLAAKAQSELAGLAAQEPSQLVRVIVQKLAGTSGAEKRVAALGGQVTRDLSIINAFSAEMTAEAAVELARTEAVRWVSLDAPVQQAAVSNKFHTWATVTGNIVRNGFTNPANMLSLVGPNGTYASGGVVKGSVTGFQPEYAPGQKITKVEVAMKLYLSTTLTNTQVPKITAYAKNKAGSIVTISPTGINGCVGAAKACLTYVDITASRTWLWDDFATLEIAIDQSLLGKGKTIYYDAVGLRITTADGSDGTTPLSMTTSADTSAISATNITNVFPKVVRATDAWNTAPYYQGSGVTVAVVDRGNFKTNGLGNRLLGVVNFNSSEHLASDQYGHGSHVTGIIADGSTTYPGVAPKVNIVGLRVADDYGMSYESDVVAALQWVYNNKTAYNIKVVNLSMNSSVYQSYHTSPLAAACEILWFNSVVVVVSAGNNGTSTLYPPANDPFVITVGATDDKNTVTLADDVVTTFSAYGMDETGRVKPDLVAPGRNIIAYLPDVNTLTIPQQHPEGIVSQNYFRMSGTSMSAPVVSGAVALLLQKAQETGVNLSPDQVKFRLMATANKNWAGYNPAMAGAGMLDIFAALNSTTTESADTGIYPSQLLSTGTDPVTFGSVGWNSVGWNSVGWNSVGWNSVGWNSVGWNSDYWGP
ncbi:MAG: S8 family peptidase [Anaerolineales bacterium]|nr:S8 family peptidase [Anaerolineales bacterium]